MMAYHAPAGPPALWPRAAQARRYISRFAASLHSFAPFIHK